MRMRWKKKGFALLFALLLLASCVTSEKYQQGLEFERQGRWDEALQFYRGALAEDQTNQTYKDAVIRARKAVAKIRYDKLRQLVDRTPEPNLPFIQAVVRDLEAVQKLNPDDLQLRQFTEGMKEKAAAMQEQLRSLYEQADAALQKEDWQAAITKLRQVNKIFPGYEEATSKLARAEQERTKALYQQGIALAKQEEWRMAAQAFKAAMEINPQYYDVAALYEQAVAKDNVDYYTSEAEKSAIAQNWERAILLLEKAIEYQPGNQQLEQKLTDLKARVGQLYFDEAFSLVNQGKLFHVAKKITRIKAYSPRLQSDQAFREFINTFCSKTLERADKYAEREMWGNALVWYQRVESVNPNFDDLFQKILVARDNINKRIKKSIAVFDFGSPTNEKDAGKVAANKLIAYLHKNASGDLRIIERENLQSILREMQLGQTGIVDVKSVQNLGKMRGIDTFIMGDVLIYSTKRSDTESNSQEKVLVDEEDVRNPEFSDWLISHPRPDEKDLSSAPPRTIKKRNYQFIPHRQGVAKVVAMLEISYKLIDTATGENIFTNTVSGKLVKEDRFQDALPAAGIQDDPLEIPTEAEVLDQLTNEKITEMGQSVLKHYQSLEVEYFNQGEQQLKRRNAEMAVERYIDAIYDEKSKGIATPISQKALEQIEKLLADR